MFALRDGSPGTYLPEATALRQETGAVLENQLTVSQGFAEHLKQGCTQNSDRLLRTPVDEKARSREIASSRGGAVSVDRCAELVS